MAERLGRARPGRQGVTGGLLREAPGSCESQGLLKAVTRSGGAPLRTVAS
jgi:hypothetical protein